MTLGGTANEAIKGLSTSPMLLLVAVINVILVGAMIYIAKSAIRRARYPDQVSDRLPEVTLRVRRGGSSLGAWMTRPYSRKVRLR